MTRERVRALLREVASGAVSVEDALGRLAAEPIEALAHSTVDHHRAVRQGYPEVVYGEGKTPEQVADVCASIAARSGRFLVTRSTDEQRAVVTSRFPEAVANPLARTVRLGGLRAPGDDAERRVLVVTAGTSDLPVAEEAVETLAALCIGSDRLIDVGVAGIHRLLSRADALLAAQAVIVVAGMDGALPSVVGGLVRGPVIAVPTSVGYGASFGGLAALLTMLNSCAAGVTVCNIDNGFGAAMSAARSLGT